MTPLLQMLSPYKTTAEIAEIAEGRLQMECEDRECAAILAAYDCLDCDCKKCIGKQAKRIVAIVKKRSPMTQFNFLDALYVLGKIGMLMVKS